MQVECSCGTQLWLVICRQCNDWLNEWYSQFCCIALQQFRCTLRPSHATDELTDAELLRLVKGERTT